MTKKEESKIMKKKRLYTMVVILAMLFGILPPNFSMAAKKVKLSSKKLSVTVGKTKTLKLTNNRKKVKWTVTSGKKCITLKSKKKTSVKIVGKRKGTAKVQAKTGKKKYVCTVTVKTKTTTKKNKKSHIDKRKAVLEVYTTSRTAPHKTVYKIKQFN